MDWNILKYIYTGQGFQCSLLFSKGNSEGKKLCSTFLKDKFNCLYNNNNKKWQLFWQPSSIKFKRKLCMCLSMCVYDSCITYRTGTATRNFTEIQMFSLLWNFVGITVLSETSHSQQQGVLDQLREPEKGNAKTNT